MVKNWCLICESLSDASGRKKMDKLEDVHRRERENLQMMEEQRERAYQAYRLHHLLSTKQVCIHLLQLFYCSLCACMQLSF